MFILFKLCWISLFSSVAVRFSSYTLPFVHLLYFTAPSMLFPPFSFIIFNHIPLSPVADLKKMGATFLVVQAEMSPMFPVGALFLQEQNTQLLAQTLICLHMSLYLALSLFLHPTLFFFSCMHFPATSRYWSPYLVALSDNRRVL